MTRHEPPAMPGIDDLLPPLDGESGPAEPLSASAQAAMVQSALASSTPPVLWTRRRFLVGGTSLAIAGVVGYMARRRWASPPETRPPVLPARPGVDVTTAQVPGTASRPRPTPAPAPTPDAKKEPAAVEPAPSSEEKTTSLRKKISAPREVADLLHQANERRRQQRFPEALRLYQQILSGHPHSEEAYVAQVAAGSLLIDRLHKPQAALRLFKHALRDRPAGTLSEEARLGLCEVQRALGDVPAERAALQEFLNQHADSPARARLAARLARLEGK